MAQANIKAVITAEDRASGVLKGFGNSVDKSTQRISVGAKIAGAALLTAASAAVTFAVKSAAEFEQTRIGLEAMLGSADKAREMLGKVSKFAAETPFEFPELAAATRQLVAFGFSGDEAFDTMKNLGDVSAAINAPIGDLAYLMGTLRTQGRAMTVDIRQFTGRGVPIIKYLAKTMGVAEKSIMSMVEAGKIGFPEVNKAFKAMTAKGGQFYGMMAKQSKSLSGLFSTLKDTLGQTARELVGITTTGDVKPGSLFDQLRKGTAWLIANLPKMIDRAGQIARAVLPQLKQWANNVVDVAKEIGDYLTPKLKALWNTVRGILPTIKQFTQAYLLVLARAIGGLLVKAVGTAIDVFNGLLNVLKPLLSWMANNKAAVMGLVGAFVALRVALLIRTGLLALQAVLVTLRMGFVATTVTTVGLRGALFALYASLGPVGIAIAGVSALAGIIAAKWGAGAAAADRQKAAQDRLREATNMLREAKNRLKESEIGLEGASLRVERAQINLREAIRQNGKKSLEAREATLELKRAKLDLRQATDDAKNATINHSKAESNYAKNGKLIQSAESKMKALQNLVNVMGVAPSSGPGKNLKPTSSINRADPAGVLSRFPENAAGTDYWRGGPTWVGERGPEVVNLPKGSSVTPNHKLGGSTININVNVGMYAGSPMEKRNIAKELFRSFQDVATQLGVKPAELLDGNNGVIIR